MYLWVRGITFLSVFMIYRLNFGTVLTVWYFVLTVWYCVLTVWYCVLTVWY